MLGRVIGVDSKILLIGLVQSLFEGAMYTFVFLWTPALTELSSSSEEIPYGVVFACYMVCIMIGSGLFGLASESYSCEAIMTINLVVALVSFTFAAVTGFESMLW